MDKIPSTTMHFQGSPSANFSTIQQNLAILFPETGAKPDLFLLLFCQFLPCVPGSSEFFTLLIKPYNG